ncbi:MAG: glycosyl transferase family 2 [Actinomycetia bacterium]|nr:glycosyl transferase family 2 [Actinomycetes bacterium]
MVGALERQTLPADRFDVVIVDNASPDDTPVRIAALVAESPLRIRSLVETKRGPAATRNTGWRSSASPLVAFIDDDCVPEPGWLAAGFAALDADERIGVVQGHTDKPAGSVLGDWTLWRHVSGPTPYFEGLNIFYRRDALERTGGFDEEIGNYGEDAALGWAVLEAGWQRDYAADAIAYHDVEERGVRYHLRTGLLDRNVARIAKRHPQFRRDAFWQPWAFRRENAAFTIALAGLLLTPWRRSALLLVLPYVRLRLPPRGHPRRSRFLFERVAVDAAQFAGMRMGSLRYRLAVL